MKIPKDWNKGKQARLTLWLSQVDRWREKFRLTREQAIGIAGENDPDNNNLQQLFWSSGEHLDFIEVFQNQEKITSPTYFIGDPLTPRGPDLEPLEPLEK